MRTSSSPSPSAVERPTAGEPARTGLPAAPVTRASRRDDLVTVALTSWLLLGLFVDGWAHNTRPQLETFFTPWHASLYSGFAATAAWMCWLVYARHRTTGGPWRASVPAGYGLGLAGLAVFAVSGLGDMTWHLAFGIEQDINALLSPTHLGLFTAGFLIGTTPLRSTWANPALGRRAGLARILPAVLSAALTGAGMAFFFMYLHPMYENVVSLGHARFLAEDVFPPTYVRRLAIEAAIPGFILSTAFLFGPLLFLLRRWQLPAGSAAIALGVQSVLMQALTGFEDQGLAVLGLVGAVAVEALLVVLRPAPGAGWRLWAYCALAPAVFWGIYFGGIGLHDGGLGWTAEVWGGAVIWSSLTLLALGVITFPMRVPAEAAEAA
jgi:hypothetical protein